MTAFLDESTFTKAITAERAILFLHAEWSGPSVYGLETFERWEAELPTLTDLPRVPTFKVQTHEKRFVQEWLDSQKMGFLTERGNGEILWLESGKIVELLPCYVYGKSTA
jgi:hypothetical protein